MKGIFPEESFLSPDAFVQEVFARNEVWTWCLFGMVKKHQHYLIDDVLQDFYSAVFRKWAKIPKDVHAKMMACLYTMLRRAFFNYLRRERAGHAQPGWRDRRRWPWDRSRWRQESSGPPCAGRAKSRHSRRTSRDMSGVRPWCPRLYEPSFVSAINASSSTAGKTCVIDQIDLLRIEKLLRIFQVHLFTHKNLE